MAAAVVLFGVLIVATLVYLVITTNNHKRAVGAKLAQIGTGTDWLAQQSNQLSSRVDEALRGTVGAMMQIGSKMQEVSDAATHMSEITKDLSRFAAVLGNPSLRGAFGQFLLERLLREVLPQGAYRLQYKFRDGSVADSVIFLDKSIIPVDAKFPLEAYGRLREIADPGERSNAWRGFAASIRARIAETSKYIKPSEGTLDFAMMYVPAETVYYECFVSSSEDPSTAPELQAYALQSRVVVVSPNSFYGYLQAVALGLRGLKLQDKTREVLGQLTTLHSEFFKLQEDIRLLDLHVGRARNKAEEVYRSAQRFGNALRQLTSANIGGKLEGAASAGDEGLIVQAGMAAPALGVLGPPEQGTTRLPTASG